MRALIDTNIFLDYVLERHPFYADAEAIILHLADEDFTGYVSAITPVNIYYFGRKMKDHEHAKKQVRRLVRLVEIARTDKHVLQDAFALDFVDYEDAVQCASAVAEDLDAIVTRNTKDFVKSPIPVYSPVEFLEVLNTEK